VGQIAGLLGCRTVGIAGGADKAAQCVGAFGYDAAIDYRDDDVGVQIDRLCPDGVDIYYDNTAGAISDAVYPRLAIGARVVVCGTASIQNWTPWPTGPRVERHLLVKRARVQGFVIFDHLNRWEASVAQLADWVRAGKLRYAEDVLDGIDACPDSLARLYRGDNRGKVVIRL
jgi:NADPH-dependent curcumin reductase CurA